MSQIAAIFEKIKENFKDSFPGEGTGEEYELIFAPFSTGFTEDDFLFLNSDNASTPEHVHKYYDELLEFSVIANTIPENDNFWTVSAQTEDYLYTKYKTLLQRLKLLDTDTLKIERLYLTTIFQKALSVINPDTNSPYVQFYHLFRRLSDELAALQGNTDAQTAETAENLHAAEGAGAADNAGTDEGAGTTGTADEGAGTTGTADEGAGTTGTADEGAGAANGAGDLAGTAGAASPAGNSTAGVASPTGNSTAALEIRLKKEALQKTLKEWKEKGDKELVETKILQLIKDEFNSFLLTLGKIRGNVLESSAFVRAHAGQGIDFYLTSCRPNNLYQSDDLSWKKITVPKKELQLLLESEEIEKYNDILGNSEVNKLDIEEINFDLLFVHVVRGWFEDSILSSPFWNCLVLDKETIEIPCFTSSLIFIRNVDITLAQNSGKNKKASPSSKATSFGPFIISKARSKKPNTFRLHSINKALAIDRGTVLNVISTIPEKQKIRRVKPSKIIQKKQRQFLRLAPQLRNTKNTASSEKALLATNLSAKIMTPLLFKKHTHTLKQVLKQVPTHKAPKSPEAPIKNGPETPEAPQAPEESPAENGTPVNELQLIGVVAQKVKPYPNPIEGADYL